MPHKFNEPRRHKIPRARYRVQNWPEYDRALQQRGSLTVWVTPEALAAWQPPSTGQRGRPRDYSDVAIETGHLLRLAFGRPWRQTEGLLRSVVGLLGLTVGVPDHTTFARRSPGLTLAAALARAQASGGPVQVVIDATGLKVYGTGEWLVEKHGERGRREWRKLHLAVDPDSGEVLACELTSNEEGDASQVAPLLGQISGPLGAVIADGAYDGECHGASPESSPGGQPARSVGFMHQSRRGVHARAMPVLGNSASGKFSASATKAATPTCRSSWPNGGAAAARTPGRSRNGRPPPQPKPGRSVPPPGGRSRRSRRPRCA